MSFKFECDLRNYRLNGHSAREGNYIAPTNYLYVEDEQKDDIRLPGIDLPEELKKSPYLTKWVGRIEGEIRVYEKITTKRGGTRWMDRTKNLPDWAIEPVMKLMKNWKMA